VRGDGGDHFRDGCSVGPRSTGAHSHHNLGPSTPPTGAHTHTHTHTQASSDTVTTQWGFCKSLADTTECLDSNGAQRAHCNTHKHKHTHTLTHTHSHTLGGLINGRSTFRVTFCLEFECFIILPQQNQSSLPPECVCCVCIFFPFCNPSRFEPLMNK